MPSRPHSVRLPTEEELVAAGWKFSTHGLSGDGGIVHRGDMHLLGSTSLCERRSGIFSGDHYRLGNWSYIPAHLCTPTPPHEVQHPGPSRGARRQAARQHRRQKKLARRLAAEARRHHELALVRRRETW